MKRGFTLIEMIVAILLSTLVLLGIIAVAASMVRQHFESLSQGELSGQALISLAQMYQDIENANVLAAPPAPVLPATSSSGNALAGCTNWSLLYGKALNSVQPVQSFYYCAAPDGTPAHPGAYDLWRYSCNSCPPATPGSCGSPDACGNPVSIVYNALYLESAEGLPPGYGNFFYYVNGGAAMHYIVGYPKPTTQHPTPVYYQVDNAVMMQKATGDGSD